MERLPEDVLVSVFELLPAETVIRAHRVSKRYFEVITANMHRFRKLEDLTVVITCNCSRITLSPRTWQSERRRHGRKRKENQPQMEILKKTTFEICKQVEFEADQLFSQLSPNLYVINMTSTGTEKQLRLVTTADLYSAMKTVLRKVAAYCTAFQQCEVVSWQDDKLADLLSLFPTLKVLALRGGNYSEDCLTRTVNNLRLKKLRLHRPENLKALTEKFLNEPGIKRLKELEVQFCCQGRAQITDEMLQERRKLKVLDVGDAVTELSSQGVEDALQEWVRGERKLKRLKVAIEQPNAVGMYQYLTRTLQKAHGRKRMRITEQNCSQGVVGFAAQEE